MRLGKCIRVASFLLVMVTIIGCEDDFSNIGGEIIDNPTDVELREVPVNAYSAKINSIQTNNLGSYFLGVNNDPVYGENTASILTQVSLARENPDFGKNVELDSVVLKIPYFSTALAPENGETNIEYELDSVFGNNPIKLSVFETNFFLNDLDPDANFEEAQKYYSDQQSEIEQNLKGEAIYVDPNFKPSKNTYTNIQAGQGGSMDTVQAPPALRLKLPVAFFKEKIIDKAGDDVLATNGNFKNYFRSLFIKAEATSAEGTLMLLDFANANAKITLHYSSEQENDTETGRTRGSFDLIFGGNNRINTYTGNFPDSILQEIEDQGPENGSENLYLKGMEGSMAVIELFNDEAQLDSLRSKKWLINEANLEFYVNQDQLGGAAEPMRLYVYDLTNNEVIIDYVNDLTINENVPALSRTTFSEPLEKDEDDKGVVYRLRVSQLVSSILNNEVEPVKLGVVITSDINNKSFSAVRQMNYGIERVPAATVANSKGTVLYGNKASDSDKRLKLKIFYTETNQ